MTRLLAIAALLLAVAPAPARAAESDRAVFPTRVQLGAAFRGQANEGSFLEGGVQVVHQRPYHLDLGVAFTFQHLLVLPGPRRSVSSLDWLADLGLELGPWLSTGPSVGAALRMFGQQGVPVDEVWIGMLGWTGEVTLMRTRTFGLQLAGRAMHDLRPVDLVLATTQVQRLRRTEVRVGLRALFGHGRAR